MKTMLFALMIALLLPACRPADEPGAQPSPFNLNEALTLRAGESGKLRGEDFTIRLLEVFDDSRCPEGVMCLWAGEVKMRFSVQDGAQTDTLLVVFPSEGPYKISGGYTLAVTNVTPYPKSGKTIRPKDYLVRFILSK